MGTSSNWKYILPIAVLVVASAGCRSRPRLEDVKPGMAEEEVREKLGKPSSVAERDGNKCLEYESWDIDPMWGNRTNIQVFHVRIDNGRVASYGRFCDLAGNKNTSSSELEADLKKLDQMKKDGLINESEYQKLRQQAIDKAGKK
jgi:hypothetical protein